MASIGNDSRPALAEVSIIESRSRFYKLRHSRNNQPEWEPCVKLDLVVPDCETQSAVDIIREHSHLPQSCDSNINVFRIEETLEISTQQIL
jgi:nitrogen regulatory protein PII